MDDASFQGSSNAHKAKRSKPVSSSSALLGGGADGFTRKKARLSTPSTSGPLLINGAANDFAGSDFAATSAQTLDKIKSTKPVSTSKALLTKPNAVNRLVMNAPPPPQSTDQRVHMRSVTPRKSTEKMSIISAPVFPIATNHDMPPPPRAPTKLSTIRAQSATPAPNLKVLKTPTLAPPSHQALRSISTPRLPTPTVDNRKLVNPNATHLDGIVLSLLQRESAGGPVDAYVPPAERPLVAGLGTSPRKHGEKAGLVKGGLAEMAKAVLARARQASVLWAAENAGSDKGRRKSGVVVPDLVVKVVKVAYVVKGGTGFGALEPPARAVLAHGVVQRISQGLNSAGSIAVKERIQVLFSVGPNDTSAGLAREGVMVAISLPWIELGAAVQAGDDAGDEGKRRTRRTPAKMPLPSPLGSGGRAEQPSSQANEGQGVSERDLRTIFCDRWVVAPEG